MERAEQEKRECYAAQRRLRDANYHLTNDYAMMCRVCISNTLVNTQGLRICHTLVAFVTCGGTCNYHKKDAN